MSRVTDTWPAGVLQESGGAQIDLSNLPDADRSWKHFPQTRILVRSGSDKNIGEGIYRIIRAQGRSIYILVQEMPYCSPDSATIDENRVLQIVQEMAR